MSAASSEHWSVSRSLAFLAATFAIVFATLLPTVVAASPTLGSPIVLCGDGDLRLIYVDDDGQPIEHDSSSSLKCAMALLSGLAATPPPDILPDAEPIAFDTEAPVLTSAAYRLPPARGPPPRPPSTAPPIA